VTHAIVAPSCPLRTPRSLRAREMIESLIASPLSASANVGSANALSKSLCRLCFFPKKNSTSRWLLKPSETRLPAGRPNGENVFGAKLRARAVRGPPRGAQTAWQPHVPHHTKMNFLHLHRNFLRLCAPPAPVTPACESLPAPSSLQKIMILIPNERRDEGIPLFSGRKS